MPRGSKALPGQVRVSMRALFGSLLRDTAGNTLGIVLATIILLVSLVGSGTDMSRAYMTKTSLQNACDAGVLAGRKAMATSGTYGTAETAKANKMFNFNFNPLATNTNTATFTTASNGVGGITGTATAVMPTVIMGIFGFKNITLTVACGAELQMASADVMFVLDTTGSMACNPDGTNCNSSSTSKIMGLRQAIRNFYTTVANAVVDKTNTRIRFGFVPYTATVNMGGILAAGQMPTSYFADTQPSRPRSRTSTRRSISARQARRLPVRRPSARTSPSPSATATGRTATRRTAAIPSVAVARPRPRPPARPIPSVRGPRFPAAGAARSAPACATRQP